ncbi:MAG: sulfurtransferase [Gammaproteobacteria bacterium]|nr:sulfurtransferase [Gammaproteobacteria bacterium]
MNTLDLPLLVEPDVLENTLGYDNLLIVDLSKSETYRKLHIPGAVHLEYAHITAAKKPVMGLLPETGTLDRLFSSIGIDEQTHVIAYDDEGGGRAARLLWTLEMAGHKHFSILNGGLHAWANEGHTHTDDPVTPGTKQFHARYNEKPSADSSYIKERLGNTDTCLLDVRSPAEYFGTKKFAERAGHIPGAVNIEWTQMMDQSRNLRFRPDDELVALLESVGVTPDKEVITYCQTHHRSAHSYIVLKHLGFKQVKGYPGSWSDWGNNPDLPVEL